MACLVQYQSDWNNCQLVQEMHAPNVRQCKVDRIERHNQILVIVDLLEGTDNARLSSDGPSKVFVRDSVLQTHAFLGDQR